MQFFLAVNQRNFSHFETIFRRKEFHQQVRALLKQTLKFEETCGFEDINGINNIYKNSSAVHIAQKGLHRGTVDL